MRAPAASLLWLAVALLVAASPLAGAHGLLSLNIQVPPQDACPAGQARCLSLVEPQPELHPGDHVDLFVWNDDEEPHRVLVADNASADPARTDTPASAALIEAQVPANGSRDAGSFTIPSDAEALYVWSDEPGREAEGAWMVVPLNRSTEEVDESPLGPGLALAAACTVALVLAARDQRRG